MEDNGKQEIPVLKFAKFIALILIITGILLFPPLFYRILSFNDLLLQDVSSLINASIIFVILGITIYLIKKHIRVSVLMFVFSCLLLIWIEFGFRIVVNFAASPDFIKKLNFQSNVTYSESQAFIGSPFLHFTGRSKVQLEGNLALSGYQPYNNFGFMGNDFYFYKPGNVIRIACIGESTTADGYPLELEKYINSINKHSQIRFEVYNFGQAYWTTAHSLTNFMLNVIDFSPDFLIIHHGWNEAKIRNYNENDFRADYSHRFKSFDTPFVFDKYIIRSSGIYRYLKFLYDKSPHWMSLAASIEYNSSGNLDYVNPKELNPFKRNLKNLTNIALLSNIKVIFATIPFSTDSNIAMKDGKGTIMQCNDLVREIANSFSENVFLCDLDKEVTGKQNHVFVDLAHITDEGRKIKSKLLGDVIYNLCDSVFIAGLQTVNRGYTSQDGIKYYVDRMKSDSMWMNNDLLIKAGKLGVPIDTVMFNDAKYLVDQDYIRNNLQSH